MAPTPHPDLPANQPAADEVDAVLAAWERERPDLDVSPLGVFSRVSRLARLLDIARREAFGAGGLEAWEFDVLSALRRAGTPYELSPGALVAQTLVTSGTMTNRIDRLTARGHVEREPSPTDRRGVIVRLTPRGQEAVDAAMELLLAHEQELLAALTPDDREHLAATLRQVLTGLEG
ncbi:transcriptional regulator, MarR family [Kytococcus aerolatus]|uniref:Transcriptional regulator, MarR family n=1 Tax=Kytococcus aerolatus TaxID=592308 RepID=A0A212U618_9MICO|nr:MarR family transcriptional regulator [Kytococcus aerolatus]SNC73677.1 transcriptional regulator, MarR family [Kytococcus aerolatus]